MREAIFDRSEENALNEAAICEAISVSPLRPWLPGLFAEPPAPDAI